MTLQVLLKVLQRSPQMLELELEVPFEAQAVLGQKWGDVSQSSYLVGRSSMRRHSPRRHRHRHPTTIPATTTTANTTRLPPPLQCRHSRLSP